MVILESFRRPSFVFPLVLFVLFIIYSPAIFVPYAFLDDYTILFAALRHDMFDISKMIVEGGRPVYALGVMWGFNAMHGIGDLRYLRAASVIGIAALATASHQAFEGADLPRPVVLAFSLLIGLMPPFQVYAAWSSLAFYPWSAFLAGLAFRTIDRARVGPLPWRRTAFSLAILTAALAINQPGAMMFWLFASIAWLTSPEVPERGDVVRAGAVMGAALIADYGLAKGLPFVLYGHGNAYARTTIVTDIPQKIVWFFNQPLLDTLNLGLIAPRVWISWSVAAFIAGGLWLHFHGSRVTARLIRMALAALLLPLAYLPNLLVAENWSSYRSQVALTSLVLLYTAIALVGWARWMRWERLVPVCAALAVITGAGLAARNVMVEFVLPQALEYRLVAHALRESKLEGARHLYFVLAKWNDTLAPVVRYDEFGLPSSCASWVPKAMAGLILQAKHSPYADLVSSASSVGDGPAPSGSTVIDLGKALREYD